MDEFLLMSGLLIAAAVIGAIAILLIRRGAADPPERTEIQTIAERVRAVGKLVGLEVHAKEIATATRGWSWLPPLVLSQARLAMIFQFERQYHVDLNAITPDKVEDLGDNRYLIRMPAVEGTLRLVDVKPYDIQQGRVLGLLDVIPMNAERQAALMRQAQDEASNLFERGDGRYQNMAADSIERQLRSLLGMLGVEVEFEWPADPGGSGEGEAGQLIVDPRVASLTGPAPAPGESRTFRLVPA